MSIGKDDLEVSIRVCMHNIYEDEDNYLRYLTEISKESMVNYLEGYYNEIKKIYDTEKKKIYGTKKITDAQELELLHNVITEILTNYNDIINYVYDSLFESGIVHEIYLDSMTKEEKESIFYLKDEQDLLFWAIVTQMEYNRVIETGDEQLITEFRMSENYNIILSLELIIDSYIEKLIHKKEVEFKKSLVQEVMKRQGLDIATINQEVFNKIIESLEKELVYALAYHVKEDDVINYLVNNVSI